MNNLRLRMNNFQGYYFYMNYKIYGDFQICISVPLRAKAYRYLIDDNSKDKKET